MDLADGICCPDAFGQDAVESTTFEEVLTQLVDCDLPSASPIGANGLAGVSHMQCRVHPESQIAPPPDTQQIADRIHRRWPFVFDEWPSDQSNPDVYGVQIFI